MAGSMNKVLLVGRLGADPRAITANSGMAISNFSLATDEGYKDKSGQKVEKTEWHRIVVFNKAAEFCNNYLSKGRLVLVEGKLQTRKWQDRDGQDRFTTEIMAQRVQSLDAKKDQAANQSSNDDYGPAFPSEADDDYGPPFPSEASGMDDAPF